MTRPTEPLRILVAGGAGFIGSHLVEHLLHRGDEVVVVDAFLTGGVHQLEHLLEHPTLRVIHADVSDGGAMRRLGQHSGPFHAIFHLASPASPEGYWTYPFETIDANTLGTKNLLALVREHGAKFLFASTSEVYGDPLVHPQVETYLGNVNPVGPRALYDESKRLGETLTIESHRRHRVDARIVRIFNTFGPRNQLDDGRMVPNFVSAALAGRPLVIHGGHQTRSLCYVDDIVDGLVRAMFCPFTNGEVINLGNPDERTVEEWADLVLKLTDSTSEKVHTSTRQDDPMRRRPDITKAKGLLHWEPQIRPEGGLRRYIEWARPRLAAQLAQLPAGSGSGR